MPQPLTPPVVAAAAPSDGGLPPALSAEAPASPAASEPAPAAGEWRQQVRQLAGEGAQQRRLDEELPPLHVSGCSVCRHTYRPASTAVLPAVLHASLWVSPADTWLPPSLPALPRPQEDQLLAAFEPKGKQRVLCVVTCCMCGLAQRSTLSSLRPATRNLPFPPSPGTPPPFCLAGAAAKQAAQAWLQASEPSPILEPQAELQAPPAATPGPAAEKRRRDESGEGSPASPQAASPAGPDEGTAGAAPTGSRPPRSPSAYSAGSGSSPGRPSLPAVPEAVGTGAFVRSGSSGLSGRLGSGHSGGRLSAERLSSYPLPDLELDQQGDSGEEEPPPFAATASEAPVASGRTPGLAPVGGLAAAAAEGAAASLRAAHMEGLSLAGVSVGDTGSLDAEREDSLEITRHTKREKR